MSRTTSLEQTFERAARLVGKRDEIDTDHLLLGMTQVRGHSGCAFSRQTRGERRGNQSRVDKSRRRAS